MNKLYIFSQILGIMASIIAILSFQMQKKWQILTLGMIANFLSVFAFLLLNGLSSAVLINFIAVLQCGHILYLIYKGKETSNTAKIIFTLCFIICGLIQYSVHLDLLPIVASILFMCSTFQKSEQKVRIWSALNVTVWIIYDLIIGTTTVFGQVFSLISILIGMYRYKCDKLN